MMASRVMRVLGASAGAAAGACFLHREYRGISGRRTRGFPAVQAPAQCEAGGDPNTVIKLRQGVGAIETAMTDGREHHRRE